LASVTSSSFILRVLSGWLVIISITVGYLLWQGQTKHLAYVDSAKLLNSYQAMIKAKKAYAVKAQGWQANIDTLTQDVQKAISQYEQLRATSSARERELSLKLIKAKQNELANYQQAIQATAQQEESKSTRLVVSQVNAFLEKYGQDHGYDLILIATPSGSIAYAKKGLDLTDEVITELNQQDTHQTK
jgi:outer membrane protein